MRSHVCTYHHPSVDSRPESVDAVRGRPCIRCRIAHLSSPVAAFVSSCIVTLPHGACAATPASGAAFALAESLGLPGSAALPPPPPPPMAPPASSSALSLWWLSWTWASTSIIDAAIGSVSTRRGCRGLRRPKFSPMSTSACNCHDSVRQHARQNLCSVWPSLCYHPPPEKRNKLPVLA